MKMTKVYTRTGDKGTTSLVGGIRISKSDIRLETYGCIDELSSHIGLLVSMLDRGNDRDALIRIQNDLFIVGNHLATDQTKTSLSSAGQLPETEIAFLEQQIDSINDILPEAQGFILPGGCMSASQAHVCRTVCRRAERSIVALAVSNVVGTEVQKFVNRLSDYLFVLAKKINFNNGVDEILWQKPCK